MEDLNISINPVPDYPYTRIAHFEGDFDGRAKENLDTIEEFLATCKRGSTLILDFSKLNFLNSYAVGHLITWRNKLSNSEGRLLITGVNESVSAALDAVGGNILFEVFYDVEKALETL